MAASEVTAPRRSVPETPASPGYGRLVSLDAFRGFTMFWIVGGSEFVKAFQKLGHNRFLDGLVYQLSHNPWQGLRFWDLIWPFFMLVVGISVPYSLAKRAVTETRSRILLSAFKRMLVLIFLGSFRGSIHSGSFTPVELGGVLHVIGVAYFAAVLLATRSARFQAITAGAILGGYALLLAFAPGPGVPAGSYSEQSNLVRAIDLALLGDAHPWGTVLSTMPAIAVTIFGMMLAGILRGNRTAAAKMKIFAVVGLAAIALGWALTPFIPVIMKLWTTSYTIMAAGWSCLAFLLFYWITDVRGYRRWAFPFVVIGMNAIAIYLGKSIVPFNKIVRIYTKGFSATLGDYGTLFEVLAVLILEWLILYWMYRRKIFIKA